MVFRGPSKQLILALLFGLSRANAQSLPDQARSPNARAPSADPAKHVLPDDSGPGEPSLPKISDPMLDPPTPARRALASWREALSRILRESTSLSTARALTAQARAEARLALAPALPTLSGEASLQTHLLRGERASEPGDPTPGSRSLPDPATRFDASLNLRVPLLAARSWYAHGTARDAIDVSALNELEMERGEIAAVANAIVSAVTAERLAEVTRVSLQSALSTLDLNRRGAALGASSSVDVLRAEQEVAASRAEVVRADEAVFRAREELGLALGSTEPWGVAPTIRLDALAEDAQANCRPEAKLESRPDVRALRATLGLAKRSAREPGYDLAPSIDALASFGYDSTTQTPNREHVAWTIGAILSWPIYDGGTRAATRAARVAQAEVARQRLTLAERRAALEVNQTLRGVAHAEKNLQLARERQGLSRETARLAKVAFLSGSGTSFDLVDAARRLREAELDFAIQEFEVLRARIAALLALSTCRL